MSDHSFYALLDTCLYLFHLCYLHEVCVIGEINILLLLFLLQCLHLPGGILLLLLLLGEFDFSVDWLYGCQCTTAVNCIPVLLYILFWF